MSRHLPPHLDMICLPNCLPQIANLLLAVLKPRWWCHGQALNPSMGEWRKRLMWMSRRLDAVKAKSPPAQLPASASPEKQVSIRHVTGLRYVLWPP